jgi:hypothetical protein
MTDEFQQGQLAERERIFALLQDHVCPGCEEQWAEYKQNWMNGTPQHEGCRGLLETIELIKTETK